MLNFRLAKTAHLRLGRRGENIAVSFLKNRGFDIIMRNYKCSSGEIDIIARDGAVICFVEVKTRRHNSKCRPAAGLGEKQKRRINKTALHYLSEIDRQQSVFRFDLAEVIISRWDTKEFRYWKEHFHIMNPRRYISS